MYKLIVRWKNKKTSEFFLSRRLTAKEIETLQCIKTDDEAYGYTYAKTFDDLLSYIGSIGITLVFPDEVAIL